MIQCLVLSGALSVCAVLSGPLTELVINVNQGWKHTVSSFFPVWKELAASFGLGGKHGVSS